MSDDALASAPAPDPHAAELADIRRKRAEVEARRTKLADEREGPAALVRERRELADAEALERFENEIGPVDEKIRVVKTSLGSIIVRRPHVAAYKRFMDLKTTKVEDCEKLVRPCVLYPDAATLDTIVDTLPGTWLRLTGALTLLAGYRAEELGEK